jgi:hypothetical protein
MLAMLGNTAGSASRREKLMSVWSDDSTSESLHESWKTSRLFGALEKMLSSSDAPGPATGKRLRNPQDDGPDGQWGFRVARTSTPLGPGAPSVVDALSRIAGGKAGSIVERVGWSGYRWTQFPYAAVAASDVAAARYLLCDHAFMVPRGRQA